MMPEKKWALVSLFATAMPPTRAGTKRVAKEPAKKRTEGKEPPPKRSKAQNVAPTLISGRVDAAQAVSYTHLTLPTKA